MSKGINLIALGIQSNIGIYGRFAYNLALSLKYHSPAVPINLIYNDDGIAHLQDRHLQFFDHLTKIKDYHYIDEGRYSPGKAKLYLYDYLGFDENLYIDVDSICVKDIEPLFEECINFYYTTVVGQCTEEQTEFREMQWAKVSFLREHYNLNGHVIPATNSSFQYIKKCKESEKLYQIIDECFQNKVPDKELNLTWGLGKQPDELYLNVALAKMNMIPQLPSEPVLYKVREALEKEDFKKYYIFSLYGGQNFTHGTVLKQYDREIKKISKDMLNTFQEFKVHPLMRNKYVDTK